jgi:pimeloyl-ACP methyl ester carboxylesterase
MIYIIFLAFTFGVLYFVFYQWQYYMIFSPMYYREDELDENYEILWIETDDGVSLEGVVYEPKEFSSSMLFFAGRAHDAVGTIKKLSYFYPNVRIITFNYRSYGKSGGRLDEQNINADALHVAKLVKKNYGEFFMLGYSLGSSVAAYVASKSSCKALFLVGTFDSVAEVAKNKYKLFRFIDITKLFRYKFDNKKYVQNIDCDTYMFVSKSDELTYIQNARNLKKYVKNLLYYKELDALSHKELLWADDVVKKINEVVS